jgi:hypothetical protein
MGYKAWHLAALEDSGYMDTNDSLINRVAHELAKSSSNLIETAEFRRACFACNVDPESFTQSDLEQLQNRLNQLE